jgi:hypothetical protein
MGKYVAREPAPDCTKARTRAASLANAGWLAAGFSKAGA